MVYLTTGKIMLQGNKYQVWCSEEFDKTLRMVDELTMTQNSCITSPLHDTENISTKLTKLDDSQITFKKQIYETPNESQPYEHSDCSSVTSDVGDSTTPQF